MSGKLNSRLMGAQVISADPPLLFFKWSIPNVNNSEQLWSDKFSFQAAALNTEFVRWYLQEQSFCLMVL